MTITETASIPNDSKFVAFRITGLSPEPFTALFGLPDVIVFRVDFDAQKDAVKQFGARKYPRTKRQIST
jgi:hypothetical protein